jgi:hypothetical protein
VLAELARGPEVEGEDPEELLAELLRGDEGLSPLREPAEEPVEQLMAGDKGVQPWDRQPGEPALWYNRFDTLYRPLGPERSLLAAYNTWRVQKGKERRSGGIGRAWTRNAQRWNWRERAEAWDAAQREQLLAEEAEERRVDRQQRIKLLKAYRARLVQVIQKLDPQGARWSEVTAGLRMVNEELRTEYGDQPAQAGLKIEQTVNVSFPEDVSDEELEAIEAALRAQAAGGGQAQ